MRKAAKQNYSLGAACEPLLGRHGRLPQHARGREQIVLEEGRLDPGHTEGDRLDGGVGESVRARKLHRAHVANVLGQEGEALVQPLRLVRRQGEEVRVVVRHLEAVHGALALLNFKKKNGTIGK